MGRLRRCDLLVRRNAAAAIDRASTVGQLYFAVGIVLRCIAHVVVVIQRDLVVIALDRSEEHTSELQSRQYLVCRLLLEKKNHQKVKELQALYKALPPYRKPDAYVDYTLNRYHSGLSSSLDHAFITRTTPLTSSD